MVVLKPAFDKVNVLGNVVFAAGLVGQKGFDHILCDAGAHQAGKVGFDPVAQASQGIGATFIERQEKVTQRLFDFFLRRFGAQRFGQLSSELLRGGRVQLATLRAAYVIHSTGFGGTGFFRAGVGEQGNQGEHQHVGRQRGDGCHVPAGIVQHIDHVQPRDIEALEVADQREQHARHPHQYPGQQTGNKATSVGRRPVQYREHARQKLQRGDKGHDAEVGQILLGAQQQVEAVAGHDNGNDQGAAGPLQPAVDITFGGRLIKRQHQVVEGHARKRQGGDDNQPAGGRKPAHISQQRQGFAVGGNTDTECEVFRIGGGAQLEAGPQDQRHGQAHQQQEQRQAPAGADQPARVEVLGEGHVIHVRHHNGRGEKYQQQGAPWPFLKRCVQCGEGGLVLQQPDFQLLRAIEHAIKRVKAHTANGDQLDHRLKGNGEYQAFVFLTGGDMPRAEEDRKQGDQCAEAQGYAVLHRLAGEDADGVGHGLDLQGQ